MCGIAGIYRLGPEPPSEAERAADRAADRALVERMLETIAYRGPDDSGLVSAGRATLGARRLAILDVAGGHQPLADDTGRVWASLNGEIYNFPGLRARLAARHPLRTRTDTELLPYLYRERGPDFVRELDGMFGLAVHDAAGETLVLARDPLGIKPLYTARVGGRLLWASELKCLLCDPALPRDFDPGALGHYLALGFVPGERTILRAVRRLRPGTRLVARLGRIAVERYWEWPRFFAGPYPDRTPVRVLADEAARRLRESAVSMLLSDVPLGVLLSGGLDSSVLVALLPEEIRRELTTYSIGFEGGGHYDERPFARCVAEHLGTCHREVAVAMNVAEELPRVAGFLDEPCADPAAVPAHLVARAAAPEVKVLLSGTGGDEIFGGYRRYRLDALLRRVSWLPRPLAAAAERALSQWTGGRRTRGAERMIWLRKLLAARTRGTSLAAYLTMFAAGTPDAWSDAIEVECDPGTTEDDLRSEMVEETGHEPRDPASLAFTVDHLYYLPDDLLLKEDRAAMGASVEGRFPYLDTSLVEFAAGLPLASRFDGLVGKRVLREIARRYLPPGIAERPKHGFSVPIEDWLRGAAGDLAGDVFAGAGSGVFRSDVLQRWLREHRAGADRAGLLWSALSLELWWRQVGSATPAQLVAAGAPLREVRARTATGDDRADCPRAA